MRNKPTLQNKGLPRYGKNLLVSRPLLVLLLLLLAFVLFSCKKTYGTAPELNVGEEIPEFEIRTLYGPTFSSSSVKGRGAVITFFNTWCPDCERVLPVIQEWMNDDPTETIYLCIARGQGNDVIMARWDDWEFTMTAAGDPDKKIYDEFTGDNGYGVPVVYIFDKEGICKKRILQNEPLER